MKPRLEHSEKRKRRNLGILEDDTIKQLEIEEKKRNISGEPESYSRQNFVAVTLSKE